jgi:hypothetical protein
MAAPSKPQKPQEWFDLTRCCPEAQADGVPCPTLGRSCEICERAVVPAETYASGPVRPPGND